MPRGERGDEILDAAARCFARYGYDKTTMEDIGKLVGMNKVSLYYYFDGKEALFKAALGREAARFDERCLEAARAERGFRARIETWISRSLRYSHESDLLRSVSAETLSSMTAMLKEYRDSAFGSAAAAIAAFIEEGKATGEAADCDSSRAAEAIIRTAFSIKRMAFAERGPGADLDAVMDLILFSVGMMLDGIEARPGAKGSKRDRR